MKLSQPNVELPPIQDTNNPTNQQGEREPPKVKKLEKEVSSLEKDLNEAQEKLKELQELKLKLAKLQSSSKESEDLQSTINKQEEVTILFTNKNYYFLNASSSPLSSLSLVPLFPTFSYSSIRQLEVSKLLVTPPQLRLRI